MGIRLTQLSTGLKVEAELGNKIVTVAYDKKIWARDIDGKQVSMNYFVKKLVVMTFCQAQLQLSAQLKAELALFPLDPATHPPNT